MKKEPVLEKVLKKSDTCSRASDNPSRIICRACGMEGPKMLVRLAVCLLGLCFFTVAGDASAHPRANFKGTAYQQLNAEYQALGSDPGSEVEYVDGPLAPLYDFLIEHRLQRFCKLLRDSGLEQVIKDLGDSWTLFAPSDASFIFLPGGTLEELQRNTQLLRDFILYHFVVGDFPSNQIQNELMVDSVQGSPLRFNIYGQILTVSGAEILEPDLLFEMGRVYIVDRPLYPIPSEDIVTYLQRNNREMYKLLVDAGLIDYLQSGTFTLLAPDDEAFGYLSIDLKNALATNISLAERILFSHILPGSVFIGGIRDGMQWQTIGGDLITFTIKRGLTFANGIPIVLPDIPLTNGVIHVINRVLLPEGIEADCQCKPSSDPSQKPGLISGGSRPSFGPTQRPPYGQGTARIPGQDISRQTPRPVGGQVSNTPGGSGQRVSQGRSQSPAPTPGQSGNRSWSPSRTGQTVRPLPPPNQVTRSPLVTQPIDSLSDEDINSVVGTGDQPVDNPRGPEQTIPTRYPPPPPPRQRLTPRPPSQSHPSQTTRTPQRGSYPGSENENYPEQEITPPQVTRQTDRWSNRQRVSTPGYPTPQRGPYRPPTTRRPQTTRTYDWNQPRVTQPTPEEPNKAVGMDTTALNQEQGLQTQRPNVQTGSWQQRKQITQTTRQTSQRTTLQPIRQPQPPQRRTTTRPSVGRTTIQPEVPSNEQPFEPSRQQPNCRRRGDRVTPFTQNLPICSQTNPDGCQNLPFDSNDPRPLCPESTRPECRQPNEPYNPSDNRPLCSLPSSEGCREFGQPTYGGDRRPPCSPSSPTQTGCKDPSTPYNPSDRRPVCRTTSAPVAPTQGNDAPQGCRRVDEIANPQDRRPLCPEEPEPQEPQQDCRSFLERPKPGDRRPLCTSSSTTQTGCKDPSAPYNPSDRRPVCRTNSAPAATTQGTDGCRRADETANAQDRRPLCPEEPQSTVIPQDCRSFLERPKPGDRRPICTGNRQPTQTPTKDSNTAQTESVKPTQQPSYPQRGQYPTQTTRRQSWQSPTRAPQIWQSTTRTPQTWQSTTKAPQTWQSTTRAPLTRQSTTRAPQTWQSTTRAPQTWQSTTRAPQTWQSTTRASQSWRSTTRTPQTWQSTSRAPQSWQSTTRAPQTWQTTRQPVGKQPQTGDGSFQTQPQSESRPSHPGYDVQPQSERHPSQPQTGRYPSQQPSFTTPFPQPQTQGISQPGGRPGQPTIPQRPGSNQGHQTGSFITSPPRRQVTTTRVPISVTGTSTTPGEDSRRTLYEIVEDPALLIRGRPVKLTRIFELFHKAGIEDILTGPGPTTVFLPSDDAFAMLPQGVIEQLEENPELLRQVLLYHVTKSEILPSAQPESYTVPSVEGNQLVITMLNGGRLIFISGAKAVAVTRANNGIFYVINQLLYPLPHHDIVGVIQSRPDLSTLAYLLPLSGLEDMLRGQTPYTFLAPTDNAFAQLPQAVYDELTRNTTALQEILLNHIIEGAHYGREFFNGGTFPSARGGKLKFQVVSYGYQVNEVNIKTPEIVTGSGVVHLIDQVLLDDSDLQFFTNLENSLAGLGETGTNAGQPGVGNQQSGFGQNTPIIPKPVSGQRVPGAPGVNQPQFGGLQPPVGQPDAVGRTPVRGQGISGNQPTSGQHQPGVGPFGQPVHGQQNPGQPPLRQPSTHGVRQPIQGQGQFQTHRQPGQQAPGQQNPGAGNQQPGRPSFGGGQRTPTHGQRTQTGTFTNQRPAPQTGGRTTPGGNLDPGSVQTGGQPNDVAELARSMGLNKFANWITNTGLLEKIHDGGVYTVFAPTDDAVSSLPQDMVYSIESNPDQVKPILQYHIVPQRLNLNSLTNEETASTLLQGKNIRFNVYSNSLPDCKQLVTASGTPLGEALATMGSIQVIPVTQVLYQPAGDLQKIIEASPILQRLNEAVKSARLNWMLSGNGPMTIFAPSDIAFDSLTEEQRKTLIDDKQAFTDLLKRHIVRGTYFSSGIQEDVDKRSENNKPLKFSLQEGVLTVNSVPVTYSDITASNGVLHVIDQFL